MDRYNGNCSQCPLITQSGHLFFAVQLPSAAVKDRNPDAHELCASTKDAANLDLVYDRDQPTSVVDSGGDPIMFLWHVPEVDAAMPICHGMLVALIGKFANEFDRLAVQSPCRHSGGDRLPRAICA